MITELNFAKLTIPAYSIAEQTNYGGVDNGVDLLLHNIREGKAIHPVEDDLPEEYIPDYAALKPLYEADENKGGVMSSVNVWRRVLHEIYLAKLAPLWRARDYDAIVDLVANTADPGPVGNGPAREEWEAAQHPEEPNHE